MVERQPSKLKVASSSLVSRSVFDIECFTFGIREITKSLKKSDKKFVIFKIVFTFAAALEGISFPFF